MGTKKNTQSLRLENDVVRIRLLGHVEIENAAGSVIESGREYSSAFRLMKYLLLHCREEVHPSDVTQNVFPLQSVSNVRVYLNRARKELDAIGLGGKNGLLLFSDGKFVLNPDYTLQVDTEQVDGLVKQIGKCPIEDPEGLALCVKALKLFRGPLFENTKDIPWAEEARAHYLNVFGIIAASTLERSKAIGEDSAIPLLTRKAALIRPDDLALNDGILRYLEQVDKDRQWPWLLRDGKVIWLEPDEKVETNLAHSTSGQYHFKNKTTGTKDTTVRVKMFGALRLENYLGQLVEQNADLKHFLVLKYLLINPGKIFRYDEILKELSPNERKEDDVGSYIRVQLQRLRNELLPLGLSGDDGLILHNGGLVYINPNYEIQTDTGLFIRLKEQLDMCPMEDPKGLDLCMEALELYGGALLERTKDEPWLTEHRKYYQRIFSAICHSTMQRTILLKDDRAIPLFCSRAVTNAPADETLHNEIIDYFIDAGLTQELIHHVAQLTRNGKAQWLKKLARS